MKEHIIQIDNDSPACVATLFGLPENQPIDDIHYRALIIHHLRNMLPSEFFEIKETTQETQKNQKQILDQIVPVITRSELKTIPGKLSFFCVSKFRSQSFKFFFDMIVRWLTPGKILKSLVVYASDFRLSELSEDVYTFCELVIHVHNEAEFKEIQRNFSIIKDEIALGIHSEFYAQRILEMKGLSADEKTATIFSYIAFLAKKFPHIYDNHIFTEMQHLLISCHDEFKANRQPRHLSRIIIVQYLFRKSLIEQVKKKAQRRHLSLKVFRALIDSDRSSKRVLSLLVGINFLRDQETFGEQHFLKAIQHYIPDSIPIDHSFLVHKLGSEDINIFYIEIEKKDGSDFTNTDIKKLRKELPTNLKSRIEQKLHPVFMPRNEEEIMRNMVNLTNQIRYLRDIPQIFVTFDEQAHKHLSFTVILARILKENAAPIPTLFKQSDTLIKFVHDRTKIMGSVRNKYPKEATVFQLKLPKDKFLRADHSIDLNKARQVVVDEISKVLGEVRDFNGGMISKQHEQLSDIRNLLSEIKDHDEMLLENFFYSLSPVAVRALINPEAFTQLYLMLLEGLKTYKQDSYYVKFLKENSNLFALVISEDFQVRKVVSQALQELAVPNGELGSASVKAYGNMCMGYICSAKDKNIRDSFFAKIEGSLKVWEQKERDTKTSKK